MVNFSMLIERKGWFVFISSSHSSSLCFIFQYPPSVLFLLSPFPAAICSGNLIIKLTDVTTGLHYKKTQLFLF